MQTMSAEAKAAYNAYMKEWRQKNPTKNAEYKKKYWERKAAELKSGKGEAGQSEKTNT